MKGNAVYFDADGNPVEVNIPDVSVFEAKIAAQDATLAERDAQISTYAADLSASKAANYDLLMSIPKDVDQKQNETDASSVDSEVDYDDLFE